MCLRCRLRENSTGIWVNNGAAWPLCSRKRLIRSRSKITRDTNFLPHGNQPEVDRMVFNCRFLVNYTKATIPPDNFCLNKTDTHNNLHTPLGCSVVLIVRAYMFSCSAACTKCTKYISNVCPSDFTAVARSGKVGPVNHLTRPVVWL